MEEMDEPEVRVKKHSLCGKRTFLEKWLIVLFLIFFILACVMWGKYNSATSGEHSERSLCLSADCVAISHQLNSYMDPNVNPCEDFYKFACGGWIARNNDGFTYVGNEEKINQEITIKIKNLLESNWKSKDNNLNTVFNQLKTFYDSCRNVNTSDEIGANSLKNQLKKLLLLATSSNFTDIMYALMKVGDLPFYDIDQFYDEGLIIKIGPPYTVFNRFLYTDKKLNSQEVVVEKIGLRLQKLVELYLEIFPEKNNTINAFAIKMKLATFLSAFFKLVLNSYINKSVTGNIEFITLFNLQIVQKINKTDWTILLTKYFGLEYNLLDKIAIKDINYMIELDNLFKNYSDSDVKELIILMFVEYSFLDNVGEKDWKQCLAYTKKYMPYSLSLIYVKSAPSKLLDSIRKDTNLIFREIKDKINEKIERIQWLRYTGKYKLREKIYGMTGYFGELKSKYVDRLFNIARHVKLDPINFFENTINLHSARFQSFQQNLKTKDTNLNELIDAISEIRPSYAVSAEYHKKVNNIAIKLGYLNPPKYTPNVPKYVTFGNLGFTIAHEVSHSIDSTGVKYELFEREKSFPRWNSHLSFDYLFDQLKYNVQTHCFHDWYPKTFDQLIRFKAGYKDTIKLNEQLTLDDNIADNSGITLAYQAYKAWENVNPKEPRLPGISLNDDQIFFISVAQSFCSTLELNLYSKLLGLDEHSPDPERMNFLVMNSENFSRVFNCPADSRMNPKTKCNFW